MAPINSNHKATVKRSDSTTRMSQLDMLRRQALFRAPIKATRRFLSAHSGQAVPNFKNLTLRYWRAPVSAAHQLVMLAHTRGDIAHYPCWRESQRKRTFVDTVIFTGILITEDGLQWVMDRCTNCAWVEDTSRRCTALPKDKIKFGGAAMSKVNVYPCRKREWVDFRISMNRNAWEEFGHEVPKLQFVGRAKYNDHSTFMVPRPHSNGLPSLMVLMSQVQGLYLNGDSATRKHIEGENSEDYDVIIQRLQEIFDAMNEKFEEAWTALPQVLPSIDTTLIDYRTCDICDEPKLQLNQKCRDRYGHLAVYLKIEHISVKGNCRHVFGSNCLLGWITTQWKNGQLPTCPNCRAPIDRLEPVIKQDAKDSRKILENYRKCYLIDVYCNKYAEIWQMQSRLEKLATDHETTRANWTLRLLKILDFLWLADEPEGRSRTMMEAKLLSQEMLQSMGSVAALAETKKSVADILQQGEDLTDANEIARIFSDLFKVLLSLPNYHEQLCYEPEAKTEGEGETRIHETEPFACRPDAEYQEGREDCINASNLTRVAYLCRREEYDAQKMAILTKDVSNVSESTSTISPVSENLGTEISLTDSPSSPSITAVSNLGCEPTRKT